MCRVKQQRKLVVDGSRVRMQSGWSRQIHTGFLGPRATWEILKQAADVSSTGVLPSTPDLSHVLRLHQRFLTRRPAGRPIKRIPTTPHADPTNKLIGRGLILHRRSFQPPPMQAGVVSGIRPRFQGLSQLDSIGSSTSPQSARHQVSALMRDGFAYPSAYTLTPGLPPPGLDYLPASPHRLPTTSLVRRLHHFPFPEGSGTASRT